MSEKITTFVLLNIFLLIHIMEYREEIEQLTATVNPEIVDFGVPRTEARTPTQASSEFITNKEQGDWAELVLFRAINGCSKNYVAVRYGKSDNLVAGEDGFDDFFKEFQVELDTIGKRPDLLVFKREDYDETLGLDISKIPHVQIDEYVKKAIAGIEVRSSAFLIEHYEDSMRQLRERCIAEAIETKDKILSQYRYLLEQPAKRSYIQILEGLNKDTINVINFRVPSWRTTPELAELSTHFKHLQQCIKTLQKRDYLSITPKVEDIKVVYKWIQTFNVPHYYFQVFFDKIYGISFKQIMELISSPEQEGQVFSIETDSKNQNKTTIKIRSTFGTEIASKVDEPSHESQRKELNRGRLLFYVTFQGGTAYLDIDNMKNILSIEGEF